MEVNLPDSIIDSLDEIYKKLKKQIPSLTKDDIFTHIIGEWLEQYKHNLSRSVKTKNEVVLRNNLREAIKLSRKTQAQIADELGINRTYLNHVIKGRCEPSITLALLLADAVNCSHGKLDSLFYIKPAKEE